MPVPVEVYLIADDEIYIKYDDGMEGEISLKKMLNKNDFSDSNVALVSSEVSIDETSNDINIGGGISLCKNAVYRQLELKALLKRLKIELPE